MIRLAAADGRRFWLWLLLAVVALRAAGFVFGVLNIDETEWSVYGSILHRGGLSYVDIAEIKPPLTHAAFIPAALFGGIEIWPMRVLGVLWILATAWLLFRAAREWTGTELAGRAAAALTVLAGLCEVPSVSAEMLMNLPAAAALFFFIRGERSGRAADGLYAGLFAGLSSMFKHQAAILIVAFGLAHIFALLRRERGPQLPRQLATLLGFALPWGATAAIYASLGHAAELGEWMIARNFGYAGRSSLFSWTRAAAAVALCLAGTALPWALAVRESLGRGGARARDPVRRSLAVVLWLTWVPVAAGGRFYEHYFLQFVPPLALLAAPQAAELVEGWATLSRSARAAFTAAALLPAAVFTAYTFARGLAGQYPNQDPKIVEVARWLREHTRPDDDLFVWGHAPQIYYLSGRRPGSRYVTAATQMGNFDPAHLPEGWDAGAHRSQRDVAALLEDLKSRRTALFVDTAPGDIHSWGRVPLASFPELDRYVHEHYRIEGRPAGALVYRRRAAP